MDEGTCKGCGGLLTRIKWNTTTDVLICENGECKMQGSPIVPGDVILKRKTKPKTPKWLGGTDGKESSYTARLQRMRESLHPEEEDPEIL